MTTSNTLELMNTTKQEKFLNSLSKRLVAMRKSRGFTQEKLSEIAELDRVALANIETGRRRPTVTTLYKISDALGVSMQDLFKEL